jgi:TonB-linked SusC/RagA family outer membrane protein
MKPFCHALLVCLLFSLAAHARIVKGKVTDEKNNALPGVSVRIKNLQGGTFTDSLGNFSINAPDPKNVLVFSYVGYTTEERAAGTTGELYITLKRLDGTLDDVVVIGYGTQNTRMVSSSIVSLSSKNIENQPIRNISEAMVGQLAGVDVQTTSGSPGTAPQIKIRGLGSIGAGNDPLYVVDGYPLSSAENFNQISPEDVEKIEVLKDAAAAAIYGSRGGNGVVIITTKRGKAGKTQFGYYSYLGIDQVNKTIDMLNGEQYVAYIKEALFYPGRGGVTAPTNLNNPSTWANTNWQDEIFRKGITQSHQVSASGGNGAIQFLMSAGHNSQEGIVLGTGFKRYNFRGNLDAQLTSKMKVSFNIAPSFTSRDDRPVSSDQFVSNYMQGMPLSSGSVGVNSIAMVQNALYLPPIIPVQLPNGDYDQPTTDPYMKGTSLAVNYFNPVAVGNLMNDHSDAMRILGNFTINYNILKGLIFKTNIGGETFNNRRNMFIPSNMAYLSAPLATFSNPVLNGILAQQRSNQNYNWLWENTLNYDFNLNNRHHFNVLGGYSSQKNTSESSGLASQAGSFGSDAIPYISTSNNIAGTASKSKNTLVSMFTRVNYNFGEKYLLSVAIRRDKSSRFGANKQYANFPSVSGGWRIAEEKFLAHHPVISELKLRASYGETGNFNIGDFNSVATLTQGNYTFGPGIGSPFYGYNPAGFTNPDLTWEKNRQTDVGIELGLFKNRIYLTGDVYIRNSTGLLTSTPISSLAGFSGFYLRNVGSIRNKGFDLMLSTKNFTGKFRWSTDVNFSLNRNKLTEYYKSSGDYYAAVFGWNTVFQVKEGGSLGDVYGLVADGVFTSADQLTKGPKWQTGSSLGDVRYKDIDGDGVITDKDRVVFANTQPKFTYGVTNTFSFKGFDLRILVQGVQGTKAVYGLDRFILSGGGFYNASAEMLDRYQSEAVPGNGIVPRYNASGNSSDFSSRFVRDASYLRIRNIALGYTLPAQVTRLLHVRAVKVNLTAQNLATFTKYPGYNPEVNIEGTSVFRTNVDQGGYPFARTYAVGLNINF